MHFALHPSTIFIAPPAFEPRAILYRLEFLTFERSWLRFLFGLIRAFSMATQSKSLWGRVYLGLRECEVSLVARAMEVHTFKHKVFHVARRVLSVARETELNSLGIVPIHLGGTASLL